jgi:hypothetical protein
MTTEARVSALLKEMAEENERRQEWWRASPYDQEGNLVMCNCATGEAVTIKLDRRQMSNLARQTRTR